jgi:hypothetical protein
MMIKIGVTGNISTRVKQICAHANDYLILARTRQAVVDMFFKLKQEAGKVGLMVNEEICSKRD